jgi:hypothetical protein
MDKMDEEKERVSPMKMSFYGADKMKQALVMQDKKKVIIIDLFCNILSSLGNLMSYNTNTKDKLKERISSSMNSNPSNRNE